MNDPSMNDTKYTLLANPLNPKLLSHALFPIPTLLAIKLTYLVVSNVTTFDPFHFLAGSLFSTPSNPLYNLHSSLSPFLSHLLHIYPHSHHPIFYTYTQFPLPYKHRHHSNHHRDGHPRLLDGPTHLPKAPSHGPSLGFRGGVVALVR